MVSIINENHYYYYFKIQQFNTYEILKTVTLKGGKSNSAE